MSYLPHFHYGLFHGPHKINYLFFRISGSPIHYRIGVSFTVKIMHFLGKLMTLFDPDTLEKLMHSKKWKEFESTFCCGRKVNLSSVKY